MSKYELSLSPDYVPNWTYLDAIREFFQNALDQETINPENTMFFDYDADKECITIGNKESNLHISSLLLGVTTKKDEATTIGQFGEGYKVATLVLLRENKEVTFYNYANKEIWSPYLVNSRRYGGLKILTFDIEKSTFGDETPDNDLTIMIEGITPEEYEEIKKSNLHLQGSILKRNSPYGDILLEEQHKNKVYVNGLFVCEYPKYNFGYDFKPAHIKLDRDRKLVSDFELEWMASMMWGYQEPDRVIELLKDKASDVKYIANSSSYNLCSIRDKACESFKTEHGENAVPVSDNYELNNVLSKCAGATPILVSEAYKTTIKGSSNYIAPKEEEIPDIRDLLTTWVNNIKMYIPENKYDEFFEILDKNLF